METEYDYPDIVQRNDGRANQSQTTIIEYGKKLSIIALAFAIASFSISGACVMWLMGRTITAELRASNAEQQGNANLAVEKRLNTQAIDELKLEMRAALKNRDTSDTHELK